MIYGSLQAEPLWNIVHTYRGQLYVLQLQVVCFQSRETLFGVPHRPSKGYILVLLPRVTPIEGS